MAMKAAIYLRVSRADLNLDNQRIPLMDYANRMGWESEVFEEKESTRHTRPVQVELYNRLCRKEFGALLIFKLDRWARSMVELVTHMTTLHEKGVLVISLRENIDLGTSGGRLFMNMLAAFADFERDIISERSKAGVDRAKAIGKIRGRHPVGCGCGLKGHDGPVKPVRENNVVTGWKREAPDG